MSISAMLETLLASVNTLMGTIDGKLRNKANAVDVYTRSDLEDSSRTIGVNAATAGKLRVPRMFRLGGQAVGEIAFDGSSSVTLTVSVPGLSDKADKSESVTPAQMDARFKELVGVAPDFLDQFSEIAAAIGNDPNFAATMTMQLASKADKSTVYTISQSDGRYLLKSEKASDSAMLGGKSPAFYASSDSVGVLEANVIDGFQKLAAALVVGAAKINSAG